MRRFASVALSALVLGAASVALAPVAAYAQSSKDAQDDARRKAEAEDAAKKKKKEKDWNTAQAPLPNSKHSGPCPYVKVLYDAGRYLELRGGQAGLLDLRDGKKGVNDVGFTGEIQNIQSDCAYKGTDPITVQMQVNFEVGRGPQAGGDHKTYKYWVAVTKRNDAVLAKNEFDLNVAFPPGVDRLAVSDHINSISIPRRSAGVLGSNFEILVGFDVSPELAEFNRGGSRFRAGATPTVAQASAKGASTQ